MGKSQDPNAVETITITNFGGRLTRKLNGDLNSGYAKFSSSFGYDPFSKPDNLTWLEAPVDITGSNITDLILASKPRFENTVQYIYSIGSSGNLYKTQPVATGSPNQPNLDTSSIVGSVLANSATYKFGASIEFFNYPSSVLGNAEQIYISSDNQINTVAFNGTADAKIGSSGYKQNTFHPLKQFAGKLNFGNGNTIGQIDFNGLIQSSVIGTGQGNLYSQLNPPLSVESTVHDLDVSIDGNYLQLTSSGIQNEQLVGASNPTDIQNAVSSDGALGLWNGVTDDLGNSTITSSTQIPSYAVTALQTYLQSNIFFSDDALGASVSDGTNKLLTLTNNKPPLPNATAVNGSFLTWAAPEAVGSTIVASLYYFGQLDSENPPGLWRMMRLSSRLAAGYIYQVPVNLLVSNKYTGANSNKVGTSVAGYGKHYISVFDQNASNNVYNLWRFLVTPTGTGSPQGGVYETQTQLFSKRITIKQVRVYCEPTVSLNGFTLELVGSDGSTIYTGSYTYSAGTDITLLQGSLERIDFNPAMLNTYAVGVRISNGGSTNMTIKKIEVDWSYAGK